MTKFSKFKLVFGNLGSVSNLSNEEFGKLQEFVCTLYGSKGTDVDIGRYQIFMKMLPGIHTCQFNGQIMNSLKT